MTNYARIRIVPEIASSSDYRSNLAGLPESVFENATVVKHFQMSIAAPTTGLTLDLGMFTTILGMVLINRSVVATEVVDAQWNHIKGTKIASANHAYTAVAPCTITDAGNALLTSGAETGSYVRAANSLTADHNGLFLIQLAAAGVLTLPEAAATTAGADAAVTFVFERRNIQGLAPNAGALIITDNVSPLADLLLTSESGTPTVDVLVFGT